MKRKYLLVDGTYENSTTIVGWLAEAQWSGWSSFLPWLKTRFRKPPGKSIEKLLAYMDERQSRWMGADRRARAARKLSQHFWLEDSVRGVKKNPNLVFLDYMFIRGRLRYEAYLASLTESFKKILSTLMKCFSINLIYEKEEEGLTALDVDLVEKGCLKHNCFLAEELQVGSEEEEDVLAEFLEAGVDELVQDDNNTEEDDV